MSSGADDSAAAIPMQTVAILLFAGAAEIVGARRVTIQVPQQATIADVEQSLCRAQNRLASLVKISRWAVGNEFVTDEFRLPSASNSPRPDIALIPPVSGG